MKKHSLRFFGVALGVLLLSTGLARGQFTSQWSTIYLPGTFNGYDTDNSSMRLVSNGVWQAYVRMTNATGVAFLFSNYQFSNPPTNNANVWKETNQSQFGVPMSGVAELNSGSDISITGTVSGIFRVTFDEVSGAYSVQRATFGKVPTDPWINEFHYDNDSTDSNEGIELAGPAGLSLTGYSLVLYDGAPANLKTYNTNILTGALTNSVGGGLGIRNFAYGVNGLRNGTDPSGIALVKNGTNVIQFLSYGGLFIPTNGPAAGMVPQDVGVTEDGNTPVGYSLQLSGAGGTYSDFAWSSPYPNSRDAINPFQLALGGPAAASVTVSSVTATPASALTNQSVSISATITTLSGASNVSPTLFWRVGDFGSFAPVRMTNAGSVWTIITNIPPQANGSVVRYYLFVNFDGPGTNSPVLNPITAPGANYSVSFSASFQAGSVWINEIDPVWDDFAVTYDEYIELAGVAGNNISGWKVELVDLNATPYATNILPAGSTFANQTNGFGFMTVGSTNLANPTPRAIFAHAADGAGQMRDVGGVRLYDANGALVHAVSYQTTLSGFTKAGDDLNGYDQYLIGEDDTLAMINTGSNLASFVWGTNTSRTYGKINNGQTLTNGNITPLPPIIVCPPDLRFDCTNNIPAYNPLSVTSSSLCAGTVTVSWVSDTNNGGAGCSGNPRIVYRTYRSVSQCGTTNTCTQFIIIENTNAPTLVAPTQTLANAGFENGSTVGWTSFGEVTNQGVDVYYPSEGLFSGVLNPAYGVVCHDSSPSGNDGDYLNGVQRNQSPATTNLGRSAIFDGTNDYVRFDGPGVNTASMTITCWIKRNGTQKDYAGLVFSRSGSALSGLDFTKTNQLGYHWNGTAETYNWFSQIVPPDNQWAFVALTVSSTNAKLYMKTATSNWAYAENVVAHAFDLFNGEIRLGSDSGSSSRYYKGGMDDVQIYDRTLSSNEIMTIWNNGQGGGTVSSLFGHYKLDDYFPGSTQSGLYQDMNATPGSKLSGIIWARQNPDNPLKGTNTVRMSLQFLNLTNGILSTTNAPLFINSSSSMTNYTRLLVRATAPANTAKARMLISYEQDSVGSLGQVLLDDASMSPAHLAASPTRSLNPISCLTMPDLRNTPLVAVSYGCSANNLIYIQSPPIGTKVTNAVFTVSVTAMDYCGNASHATFQAFVDDTSETQVFTINPVSTTTTCPSNQVPTTQTVFENCPEWTVTLFSSGTNNGAGCAGNPLIITNVYKFEDIGENVKFATQIVTVVDSVSPTVGLSIPALTNGGFETGGFAPWSTYNNASILGTTPHTGTKHAKLAGQTNGTANYNGLYQDLPCSEGEIWRLGAWAQTPAGEPISGGSYLEAKIEFMDEAFTLLQSSAAPLFSSGTVSPGNYREFIVDAIAPAGASIARATLNYVQTNNATGAIYIDDVTLSRTIYSATNGTDATIGDITSLVTSYDCGFVTVTQSPPSGVTIPTGTNTVRLYSVDNCGNTITSAIPVIVIASQIVPDAPTNVAAVAFSLAFNAAGVSNVVRSTGSSEWSVLPEYVTNLIGLQAWQAASNISTTWTNGTNVTTFTIPTSALPAFIRVKQTYP